MKKLSSLLVLLLLAGTLNVPVSLGQTIPEGPFSDVPAAPYHFNAEAIAKLKAAGVVQGYADKTYKPETKVNRAEFAKIIAAALFENPTGKNCFKDVKEDWSAPYICELKRRGIVSGYSDGTYRGAEKIKFSEATKIVAKAYNLQLDASANRYWYEAPVKAMAVKKAIPLSVEFFDKETTRGEMAEMIWRLKDKIEYKSSRSFEEITGQQLVSVASCPDLKQRYEEAQFPHGYDLYNYGGDPAMYKNELSAPESAPAPAPMTAAPMLDSATSASQPTGNGAGEYSTTNVQVSGVDEADIIKNDGKYIYILKGKSIRVVEAYPAENLKELVTVQLGEQDENFYPSEMYVDGDRLMVIGTVSQNYYGSDQPMPMLSKMIAPSYFRSQTKLFVLNVVNRSKPVIERSVVFDGSYRSSRKIGGSLYLVMNHYPSIPYKDPMKPWEFEARDLVPKIKDSAKSIEELAAPCNKIMILPKPNQFNFIVTAAVPVYDKTKEISRSVVIGNTENIYASKNNLYIASTDWGEGYYRPMNDYGTALYQFALGDGTIEFKNRGVVPGTILNQFSMDEHNGYFRIATTKYVYDDEEDPTVRPTNNLYILDQNMKKTGSIENIAPGEKIYSTRFMGDRGYMVTFKQVDPLFVLDLKDPAKPKISGELKIPGYSTYLHPYDENHIIGFGNDVDESQSTSENFISYTAVQGLKMAMFDITDVNNPKEMFKEVIGVRGTHSELLNNHKALLFDKSKNLLAFPVTETAFEEQTACFNYTYSSCPNSCTKICTPSVCTYENGVKVCTSDCDGPKSCSVPTYVQPKTVFDGAYVYNLDLMSGFKLKGKVSHYNDKDAAALKVQGYPNYQKTIQRLLYIGENLYSVSMSAVKANALSDLAEKKLAELAGSTDEVYYGKPVPLMME